MKYLRHQVHFLVHKLLLVPITRVHCCPQLVPGEVVFDYIGLVFPTCSAWTCETVKHYLPPHLPEFAGRGEKIHLQKLKPIESK